MSVAITAGEIVYMPHEGLTREKLDFQSCGVLSRFLNRNASGAHIVADSAMPPYTHLILLGSAMFRVVLVELTPREAADAGLSRPVPAEEAQGPFDAVVVGLHLSPGEAVEAAILGGLKGWRWPV